MNDARTLWRVAWLTPALVGWVAAAVGCITSTSYAPKRTDQVQLVLHNRQVYLHHGTQTIPADQSVPLDILGQQTHQSFFDCDATAAASYQEAQQHFQIASNIEWFDDVYDCVTCGCGSTRLCSPLNSTIFNFEHYNRMHGYARVVDAVNRFNDVPACTGTAASPAASQPAAGGAP